jgi:hypothetical protein
MTRIDLNTLKALPQGDANWYRVMDAQGHWVAIVQFNGELSDQVQMNLLERMAPPQTELKEPNK